MILKVGSARFDPWRYIAIETAISVAINTTLGVAPALLSLAVLHTGSRRSAHEVAVSLTPQVLMCALMSALVPLLLTRRRRGLGKACLGRACRRPTLGKTVIVAGALALTFTCLALATIHLLLPSLTGGGLGAGAVVLLTGTQGALSAAIVTPLALLLVFGVDGNAAITRAG